VGGYTAMTRPEARPPATLVDTLLPIAQQYTFGDPRQAAYLVDVAMRTANPGVDGRVGAEQVVSKLLEIANPPMKTRTGRSNGRGPAGS